MTWRSFLLPKPRPFIVRLAVLAGMLPILGRLGGGFWLLDLCNHFQVRYAVLLALAVVALLCLKARRHAAVAALFLIVPLIRLGPLFLPVKSAGPAVAVRVVAFNVLSANTRHADTVGWIRAADPDVVFLPEVDPSWAAGLQPLRASHPHAIEHIVAGNFGFAFFSKRPILRHEIIPCGRLGLPLLKVRVAGERGDFAVFGAHPVPPVTPFWAGERDEFLRRMAEEAAKETLPVIVAGDLNATRWSHGMQPLFDAGLRDTADGRGLGSTWMRGHPLLALPIDHILFRAPGAVCLDRRIGPDLGSDHRPVVADIGW